MIHLQVHSIDWMCDGMRPLEDCRLPSNLLVIGVPKNWRTSEFFEFLCMHLEEIYGFHIGSKGFYWDVFLPDCLISPGSKFFSRDPLANRVQAVIDCPKGKSDDGNH